MARIQPVKNLSGGGFAFEDKLGAIAAASLLSGFPLAGQDLGPPVRIEFQVGSDGWPLDDLLLTFESNDRTIRCSISVKSFPYIEPRAPKELVGSCWQSLLEESCPFEPEYDLLGIATAPLGAGVASDLHELIRLSLHQEPTSLDKRIKSGRYVSDRRAELWKSFAPPEDHANEIETLSTSPAEVLRRLRVLEFDFDRTPSTSLTQSQSACTDLTVNPEQAGQLWAELLRITSDVRTAGGRLDEAILIRELPKNIPLRTDRTLRAAALQRLRTESSARAVERWRATGVEDEVAVRLANDRAIGQPEFPIAETGLTVVEADFGYGKSLSAERHHQANIERYGSRFDPRIPIFVRSRQVTDNLESVVKHQSSRLGDALVEGFNLVIDGLEEIGHAAGNQLLEEARALARSNETSSVLATTRPGLQTLGDEVVSIDPLDEERLRRLSELVSGDRFALSTTTGPSRDAIYTPLFALIALKLVSHSRSIPSSPSLLLQALVEDALAGSRFEVMSQVDSLSIGAKQALSGDGTFSEGDLGGPDIAAALVRTRLVTTSGRRFRFALPVLEHYFGAYALLRNHVDPETDIPSLSAFESWRYAYAIAASLGSWQESLSLTKRIGERWPGAAAWIVGEAWRENSLIADPDYRPSGDWRERADMVENCLGAWGEWLNDLGPVTKLGHLRGRPDRIEAVQNNGYFTIGLFDHDSAQAAIGPLDRPLTQPDGRGRPGLRLGQSGRIETEQPGWPWHWTRGWVSDEIERLLLDRRLVPEDDQTIMGDELWWQFVRKVTHSTGSMLHPPIEARTVVDRITAVLHRHEGGPPPVSVGFNGHRPSYSYEELLLALERAERAGDASFERPWPAPDAPRLGDGSIDRLYSLELTVELIRDVNTVALDLYRLLVERWFPQWAETLGLYAAMPVHLEMVLLDDPPAYAPGAVATTTRLLDAHERSFATVEVGGSTEQYRAEMWERWKKQKPPSLVAQRPDTAGWISTTDSVGDYYISGDMPATDLAYSWLAEDLAELGLLKSPLRWTR